MKTNVSKFSIVAGLLAMCCAKPQGAMACATCLGAPDSPLTAGLNWGIASLLLVVMVVLGGAVSFFIYLARRSAAMGQSNSGPILSDTREKVQ